MTNSGEQSVRVLLADDHRLMVNGIRNALERSGEFTVVGEASNGSEVPVLVRRTHPDVVVLDLRMPGMDGLTCLDEIKRHHPDVKVIMLSVSSDQRLIDNAIQRGASGYVVKSINPADLPAVIRKAMEKTIDTAVGLPENTAQASAKAAGLTRRELDILTAVTHGRSNQTIATELWVAPQTVKFHLTNIYRKLGAANRTDAARLAYQLGLVDSSPLDADHDGA